MRAVFRISNEKESAEKKHSSTVLVALDILCILHALSPVKETSCYITHRIMAKRKTQNSKNTAWLLKVALYIVCL